LKAGEGKKVFSSPKHPDCLSLLFHVYWGPFMEAKQLGHDFDHSSPPSAEVRNE